MPSCYGMTAIKFNSQIRSYFKEKKELMEKMTIIDKNYGNSLINFIRISLLNILKENGFDLYEYRKICEEAQSINTNKGKELKAAIKANLKNNKLNKEKIKQDLSGPFYF
jgi:hypothetical protein